MESRTEAELQQTVSQFIRHYNNVLSNLAVISFLDRGLADEYKQETARLKKELAVIVSLPPNTENIASLLNAVPLYFCAADILAAKIELANTGKFRQSPEKYELLLAQDGLQVSDVSEALSDYHQEVANFIGLQKAVSGMHVPFVNSSDVLEYKRLCESIILELDNLASQVFRKKIMTPANFDVKENNPHQMLGQINVGYEGIKPSLVMVIAHEGPFGHNTHETMSQYSANLKLSCRHTQEGLAVFGERLALQMMYKNTPVPKDESDLLINFLMTKRRINDSMGTVLEKMIFYDRATADYISKSLATPIMPAELIEQNMSNICGQREKSCNVLGAHYYVGFKMIDQIYQSALSRLAAVIVDDNERESLHNEVVRLMFDGQRPASVVRRQVEYAIDALETKRKLADSSSMP